MLLTIQQPEPLQFNETVRQPGQKFLSKKGISSGPTPKKFRWNSYWRKCIPDLYAAYNSTCAFSGLRIAQITGAKTVEHFLPKSLYPEQAYEWKNFRLVSARLNGRKRDWLDVMDPFLVPKYCFYIDFFTGLLTINPLISNEDYILADSTITRLKLNSDKTLVKNRLEAYEDYIARDISALIFQRENPFAYAEAVRQDLLRPEDRP